MRIVPDLYFMYCASPRVPHAPVPGIPCYVWHIRETLMVGSPPFGRTAPYWARCVDTLELRFWNGEAWISRDMATRHNWPPIVPVTWVSR